MSLKEVISSIFDESDEKAALIDDAEELLKYGMATEHFLYLDYKGEEGYEIVNYILDYEFKHHLELASAEELEQLGEFEYEYVPDKIREVNKIITAKGYGLFAYPTEGDYYALFMAKLERIEALLQVEIIADDYLPSQARYIQFYE